MQADVLALVEAFDQLGNPFLEDTGELYDLDESIVMAAEVVDNVRKVEDIGKKKYRDFVDKRIYSRKEPFTATMTLTKLKLFKSAKTQSIKKSELNVYKEQQVKANQILLAANSGRVIDESVFSHESSAFPPSLTRKGQMHHTTKSEILDCIEPKDIEVDRPMTTAAILDGAVLVQMLRPGGAQNIEQYITDVFVPYILTWLERNSRVDIVFDVYSKTSLKSGTRQQRGTGARRRVTLATKVPSNWAAFLRVDKNKQELFTELGKRLQMLALPEVIHHNKFVLDS